MRFWDTSAIVSLLAIEAPSWKTQELFRQDPKIAFWWGTPVECVSTLTRVQREGQMAELALQRAWAIFQSLRAGALEIQPDEDIRRSAERLLSKHPLRAGDSFQLAAALAWREGHPIGASFVTFDRRLKTAASLEGFRVLPSADEIHEAVLLDRVVYELRDRSLPYGEPARQE